jgi:hypothetical protein
VDLSFGKSYHPDTRIYFYFFISLTYIAPTTPVKLPNRQCGWNFPCFPRCMADRRYNKSLWYDPHRPLEPINDFLLHLDHTLLCQLAVFFFILSSFLVTCLVNTIFRCHLGWSRPYSHCTGDLLLFCGLRSDLSMSLL